MAVNVSTILSVCLYCKTNSEADAEKEFHEIFDEVGSELQLPTLVEKFFHKKLINKGKQLLCEDCVNRLIELYDVEEHAKEKRRDEGAGDIEIGISEEKNSGYKQIESKEPKNPSPNICEEIDNAEDQEIEIEEENDELEIVKPKRIANLLYSDNKKIGAPHNNDTPQYNERNTKQIHQHIEDNVIEPTNTIDGFHYDNATHISNHTEEVFPNGDDVVTELLKDNEVSYDDLTVDNDTDNEYKKVEPTNEGKNIHSNKRQISNHAEKDLKPYEYNELNETNCMENGQYDEDYNESPISNRIEPHSKHGKYQEIELGNNREVPYNLSSEDDPDSDVQLIEILDEIILEGTESSKEFETNENQNDNEISEGQITDTDKIYCSEQNEITEEHAYEDEYDSLLECISEKSNDNNMNLDDIEEFREDDNSEEGFAVEDKKSTVKNNVNKEASNFNQDSDNIVEIDHSNDLILQDSQTNGYLIVMEEMTENTLDENMTMEEEYLVEELISCDKFDSVDLNEYFDKNVMTKFDQLELQWSLECKLCLQKYDTFQNLLKHSCINELFKDEKPGCCILKECDEIMNNLKSLARHLILYHYEKIESLSIYSNCTDCDKRFSNLIDLNKHSCCRTIKRKAGARNFCQSCDMDFPSLKRYIFHMQFHYTKHRPKVCLLCGALFSNSNDFFDHTQYNHEPDNSMACMTCDRFFKDKFVYEKHMEIHDESQCNFACTYCPKKYTKRSGLVAHMEIYHNFKTKTLRCTYCDKDFAAISSYRSHMKSHVPESDLPAFVCSECGLMSSSSDMMKDHMEMDEESSCNTAIIIEELLSACYTCENCSMDFHTMQHLQKHRLSKNHSDKLFYCPLCRKAFTTLKHMRNHATNHKDYEQWEDMFPISRLYMCNIGNCEEAYPLWTSLYYHKKRPHKKDKEVLQDFKCQFCQKSCLTKMSLAVHIARSHNSTNASCPNCERVFKNKKLLQDHINKFHTAVKCSLCDKDFKNRRNLDAHTNSVHDNVKRFFCRHCEKGYFFKSEMEHHEKNVHPDVSYKCEICNFVTTYPKSLEIHMNNHYNKLSFKCTICSKAFGRKQLLSVHMKRHEEFTCSDYCEQGCDSLFLTYSLMKTHIQTIHENHKEDRKKVNTTKRKRSPNKSLEVAETKDYTEGKNNTPKCRKTTTSILLKDIDSKNDSLDELLEEHFTSDNESVVQYEYEINDTCE